jgi:hypothetical protein
LGKTLGIRWEFVGNSLGIRWESQSIVSQLYTNSGAKQSTWTCGRVGLVGAGDFAVEDRSPRRHGSVIRCKHLDIPRPELKGVRQLHPIADGRQSRSSQTYGFLTERETRSSEEPRMTSETSKDGQHLSVARRNFSQALLAL